MPCYLATSAGPSSESDCPLQDERTFLKNLSLGGTLEHKDKDETDKYAITSLKNRRLVIDLFLKVCGCGDGLLGFHWKAKHPGQPSSPELHISGGYLQSD